jgi:surfeit locus 1 family protein
MMAAPEQRGGSDFDEDEPRLRSVASKVLLAFFALFFFAGFVALGTWQLYRLQWKLDLIERVNQRVHAAPVPAPGPERWPTITAKSDEYRHVKLTGAYRYDLTTHVQATTGLGSGYWLLTPLCTTDGHIVMINRGFVPLQDVAGWRAGPIEREPPGSSACNARAVSGKVEVTGLLRISEAGGTFLRHNEPATNRWYSRDVQAMAEAHGLPLTQVAPYFVDAAVDGEHVLVPPVYIPPERPLGGLTVISFPNNHLIYAFTWYALALMVAAASWWVIRDERKALRRGTEAARAVRRD